MGVALPVSDEVESVFRAVLSPDWPSVAMPLELSPDAVRVGMLNPVGVLDVVN